MFVCPEYLASRLATWSRRIFPPQSALPSQDSPGPSTAKAKRCDAKRHELRVMSPRWLRRQLLEHLLLPLLLLLALPNSNVNLEHQAATF